MSKPVIKILPKLPDSCKYAGELIHFGFIIPDEVRMGFTITNNFKIHECECKVVTVDPEISKSGQYSKYQMMVRLKGTDVFQNRWFSLDKKIVAKELMQQTLDTVNTLGDISLQLDNTYKDAYSIVYPDKKSK